jgi:hypothetical protein
MFDPHATLELVLRPVDGLTRAELLDRLDAVRALRAWLDEREAVRRVAAERAGDPAC